MAWRFPDLSRRTFLKATGYGSAGLTLLKPVSLLGMNPGDQPADAEETSYSICNFCSSLCNLRVTSRSRYGVKRIV